MLPNGWVIPVLVLAGMAGCLTDGSDIHSENPSDLELETELSTFISTPSMAARDFADQRRADVLPAGDPRYLAVDALIEAFMETHGTPTASIAIMLDGRLRYANAFGPQDVNGGTPATPDSMFRIASLTKPVTAAVVNLLVEQHLLDWQDRVFCAPAMGEGCILQIPVHSARRVGDDRLYDLTVRHLIDHQTGWTRTTCDEALWWGGPIAVSQAFDIPLPVPAWRLAQWQMGTEMEFEPGSDPGDLDGYCNMGYIILGLLAEQVTGVTLQALYEGYIWRPLDIQGSIATGATLTQHPQEVFYACDGDPGPSVFEPNVTVQCRPYGVFDLEAVQAAGGLVSTAEAIATIFHAYRNDGSQEEMDGPVSYDVHSGGLSGTATTTGRYYLEAGDARADVAILFNSEAGLDELPSETYVPRDFQQLHAVLSSLIAEAEYGVI